jgi:glycosyltransferase involved in cell wall biosynthesis
MVNATRPSTMHLDIVIPIFNEEETLPELSRRIEQTCARLDDVDWRVIYVNDGSRDRSRELILEQRRQDPRFTLLDLSRNFGHQCAISAGLAHTDAEAAVVMDGDLQDPPEVIPDLLACWRNKGEVVYAVRRSRSEKGVRRLGLEVFHKFFYWLSDFPMPTQTGVFGLLDRKAVEEFNRLTEKNRFIPGLRSWIGFEQRMVHYDRPDRAAGVPKQTLRRLVRYALDGVFSFSYKPLRLMTYAGLGISIIGFGLAGMYAVKRLLGIETAQTGFTTLVTLVLFLGGVQLIAVGLLGEYIGRVYDEVKQRPLYIVRGRHGLEIADSAKERQAKH